MPSLIPGFEYDIFISYRQKDNKGGRQGAPSYGATQSREAGWVSEFVEALKTELESTFKEEISVYFDINPHDGLLETHDVDESLKEKLKCFVFIPIISRTYCDPKSFAWEHEFKAFVDEASKDQFGLKVKLPNGNIAGRVLPVLIHDLDANDIRLCESVLGGVLRGVEFVYKEPGVNRSLTLKDKEKKNQNGTIYRNQINKVALAIKEIIQGMKAAPVSVVKETAVISKELSEEVGKEEKKEVQEKPAKLSKRKLLTGAFILVVLIIAAIFAYPIIFKRDTLEKLRSSGERISVTVMPFQNMTNDTLWNVWQDGIQDMLITSLSNSEDLKVRQRESIISLLENKGTINYASITPAVASTISQKLEASVFICGSINQAGSTIRLNAQLINSKTAEVYKSFQIEGPSKEEDILSIIDSLSVMVKSYLIISKLQKELSPELRSFISTNSPEAYKYFIYGQKAFDKLDYLTAQKWLSLAISFDSNFFYAIRKLSITYGNQGLYDQAKKWCLRAYEKRDQLPIQLMIDISRVYAAYFETPDEQIKYLKQLLDFDDQTLNAYYNLGNCYLGLEQYNKAIPEYEKVLEIYKKWDVKPAWTPNYTALGRAYHETGQYRKENKLYKKAEQDFPDDYHIIYRQIILALTGGDTVSANDFIKKYISLRKESSASEAVITTNLAVIYSEAGIMDKAETKFREALSLEPDKPDRINSLAYFLIDKDRNIEEGLDLVNKALELSSDNYIYLHIKGWGLYKQGKYKEALEILQKSWDLRMKNAVYNHEAYLHLEAVKKAAAGQNKNN